MTHQIKNIHKSAHLKLQKLAFYIKEILHFLFLVKAIIIGGRVCQLKHYLHISTNCSHIFGFVI